MTYRGIGVKSADLHLCRQRTAPADDDDDAQGRKKLAGYMRRAPLSLARMSYDAASGTALYRSKMHLG